MISVLILTNDEEINVGRCLDGVSWSDDVIIFDSGSTDRTVEIARAAGARVYQRNFDNYGAQREAARTTVEYKYPWVLAVDADERPDQELIREIQKIACLDISAHNAYRVRRKDYFLGQWIRHSTLYPSWFIRFYHWDKIRYEPRTVHEYPEVQGSVGQLQGHLVHNSFNKGLDDWRRKHIRYAAFEAAETLKSLRSGKIDWAGVLSLGDPVRRRRALKGLSFRLPGRPLLRFIYMYLIRLGFLDGWPGLRYCRLLAWYESMIVQKIKELRRQARTRPL